MEDFKMRLKKALEIREMRPVDLAERTGISRSVISSYLAGRWKAKQDNLYLMSKAMNVNPAWLMGYDVSFDGDEVSLSKKSKSAPELSRKDEREIESDLEDMMNSISSAAYEGEDDIEDLEAFKATIKAAMIQAKKIAKKKYTPKKYRKDK